MRSRCSPLRAMARPLRVAHARLEQIAAARAMRPVLSRLGGWEVLALRRSRSGTIVARVQAKRRSGQVAYLKVAREPHGVDRLMHERGALEDLSADDRLADEQRQLIPKPIDEGSVGAWHFLLQEAKPGVPAVRLGTSLEPIDPLVTQASAIAGRLHASNAHPRLVGEEAIATWIERPTALVRSLVRPDAAGLDRVQDQLVGALAGSSQLVGWAHGDYWPENLLVDEESGVITGIVDWDSADPAALALHDQVHLVLSSRKMQSRGSIGAEIVRALEPGETWSPVEQSVVTAITEGLEMEAGAERLRVALILYWLRLVAVNMTRQPRTTASRAWIRLNVSNVVASL